VEDKIFVEAGSLFKILSLEEIELVSAILLVAMLLLLASL